MRLRNISGSREIIADSKYVIQDAENQKGKIRTYFEKDQPIQIEIGMGKGRFIMQMAEEHPEINFIGIEKRYDEILKKDGVIEFKTDNRDLFDFAVEQLEPAGWKAEVITYDLHHDPVLCEGNIMTEYEEKFSSIGNPICKYVIYR